MKINADDFIKIGNGDQVWNDPHKWEVFMPIGGGRFRTCTFAREEYETGEALHEAVLDLLRGCRFSDTEYHVFMDDKLVMDLRGGNVGQKTKIGWCDSTWNPVTGCLHGCEYCYARKHARRFGGGYTFCCDEKKDEHGNIVYDEEGMPVFERLGAYPYEATGECHVLGNRCTENDAYTYSEAVEKNEGRAPKKYPYPFYFDPTLHRYLLSQPRKWKQPRTIFVCSMADLFGDWVPDEWIQEVFSACKKAPQHRYMFLTKNPARYMELYKKSILPSGAEDYGRFWFGTSVTTKDMPFFWSELNTTFTSIEPILEPFGERFMAWSKGVTDWIIIGAETGNRKGKIKPEKEWIDEIVRTAQRWNKPVFMKESLRSLMGADFLQEFPWED